jgi:hypothetical protein
MQFLGLGWSSDYFKLTTSTNYYRDFFGIATYSRPYGYVAPGPTYTYSSSLRVIDYAESGDGETITAPWGLGYYYADAFETITKNQGIAFFGGVEANAPIITNVTNIAGATKTGTTFTANDQILSFPLGETDGNIVTFLWDVWGSPVDKTVYCRMVKDRTGLTGDDMFSAFDGKTTGNARDNIKSLTIHGNVTSEWRNSDNTMNFPRWFKMQCSMPSYTLKLLDLKWRYYEYGENITTT